MRGIIMMSKQRMIELLEIEHECMMRKSHNDCDSVCQNCELVQDDKDLHEMYTNVIVLLKAQEPMKPLRKPELFDSLYFCGKCSAKVGFQIRKDDSWRFKCNYCPECGQAVKW